ncbi:MAG: arginine--tRNA ligase [Candidatus Omnitrophota bacterium]
MKKNTQDIIISIINDVLKTIGAQDCVLYLDIPDSSSFGDYSTNIALKLSKSMKKAPIEIAGLIVSEIEKSIPGSPAKEYIKEVKVEGAGFINFYLRNEYFYGELRKILKNGKGALRLSLGNGKKVLIEFVSANPTGSLSVAHARQAAVGDVLANIMSFAGFKVKREYYLNDEGNQINILGDSVRLRLLELKGEEIEFPQNYYQGDYIYDIAKSIQGREGKVKDLGGYAAGYILEIIRKELFDFGVDFDYWYSQKKLRESGKIKKAFQLLKKKGFLYEQEGALWFKSTLFGDDKDRVVVKSDGSFTYLAPDIAYHQDKFRRGFNWLINLWGPDHHGYIKRLTASVEALGRGVDSLSVIIVQLATIFRDGKPVQMSTRKGQYITLREVLDEVGRDASRFFFLMRRTSSHLDFDLDAAKKQNAENPVYYVQYAHARICSVLRNSKTTLKPSGFDLGLLREKEELELLKKLKQLSYILEVCSKTLDPYMLTVYLQELAEAFHKFYDTHRVLGQEDKLTRARLALLEGTRVVIATALEILGVSLPQSM